MSVSLERRMGETYLDMDMVEPANEFTYRMLENNQIGGLIALQRTADNGAHKISFKVTGMEPLSGQIKRRKYTGSDVRCLMWAIERAQAECKRHMIDPDGILLAADFIFYDYGTSEYKFIYWESGDAPDRLRELMEYLMQNLDHSDEEAVRVIYSLYDSMDNENFDLGPYLSKYMGGAPVGTKKKRKSAPAPEFKEPKVQQMAPLATYELDDDDDDDLSLKDIIFGKFKSRIQKKTNDQPQPQVQTAEIRQPRSEVIFEPQKAVTYETILLAEDNEVRGNLKVISTGEYFHIEKPAILIGKSMENADFVLDDPSVSRVHAEITHDNSGYYISDKNSKNGIWINEEKLELGRIEKLSVGDRIRLGSVVMTFD